jgi:RNA polymerase sigma factor (sigma-70 family)
VSGSSPRGFGSPLDDTAPAAGLVDQTDATNSQDRLQTLRNVLTSDYGPLVRRLARRLNSRDKAQEALHETFLKLNAAPLVGEVRNPFAYVYRMTLNLAHNARQREARMIPVAPSLLHALADEAPSPERDALARVDVGKMHDILASFPERRRAIFLARWRDDLTHGEIALRLGIHKRTVQKELAKTERLLRACAANS